MRSTFLPFALPDTDDTEIAEVTEAIRSGWVTTGPKVKQFETEFSRYVGAKYAVAVNSCTAALHLALDAIGLKPEDEVITTPLTFAATTEVIRYFNARPVFVDVDAGCLNIDIQKIEKAITPRTRAIIPVHLAGFPVDMDAVCSIAHKWDLKVIEDAAHSLPTIYNHRSKTSLGDIVCFSFYATKTLTTGEGGMICTENEIWADHCRFMSLHGISSGAWSRYTQEGSWYYEILAPGYKYNMTDVAAAMGIAQLRKVEKMWQRRLDIAHKYNQAFSAMPELQIPLIPQDETSHGWHLYILRLNLERLCISRTEFIERLRVKNIGTSVHFIPLHIHPYYQKTYGYKAQDFPVAFNEYQRIISLPIYSRMSEQDIQDVIEAVKDVVKSTAI